jgi:hypothetical protein
MIRALVVKEPDLMLVGAIFKAFTVGAQTYAPTRRDHLAAHFPFTGRAQCHIWKISVFDGLLFNVGCADAEPLGQVFSRVRNRFFSSESHSRSGYLSRDLLVTATNESAAIFVPCDLFASMLTHILRLGVSERQKFRCRREPTRLDQDSVQQIVDRADLLYLAREDIKNVKECVELLRNTPDEVDCFEIERDRKIARQLLKNRSEKITEQVL